MRYFVILWMAMLGVPLIAQYNPADTTSAHRHRETARGYEERADYEHALSHYHHAHLLYEWQSQPSQEMHLKMATMYAEMMHWDSATIITDYYLQQHCPPTPFICAKANKTMGRILITQGDFEAAIPYYLESLRLFEAYHGGDSEQSASLCLALGHCHYQLQQWQAALQYFQKAETLLLEYNDLSDIHLVRLYTGLGDLYQAQSDRERATRWYLKAIHLLQTFRSTTHPEAIHLYYRLSYCTDSISLQRQYTRQALDISLQNGGNHPATGLVLDRLAQQALSAQDTALAAQYYTQAAQFYQRTDGSKQTELALVYMHWGRLQAQYNPAAALSRYRQAIQTVLPAQGNTLSTDIVHACNFWDETTHLVLWSITEQAKLLQLDHNTTPLRQAADYIAIGDQIIQKALSLPIREQDAPQADQTIRQFYETGIALAATLQLTEKTTDWAQLAFAYSDRQKAAAIKLAMNAYEGIRFGEVPDSLQDLEHRRLHQRDMRFTEWQTALHKGWTSYAQKAQQAYLQAQNDYESLIHTLRLDYPRHHQLRYRFPAVPVATLQKTLAADQMLIAYQRLADKTYIYALSAQDMRMRVLPNTDDLSQQIAQFNRLLHQPNGDVQGYKQAAHALYQLLLEPELTPAPATTQRLLIVADKEISSLPVEALLSSTNGTTFQDLDYLLRRYAVSYHSTATAYLFNSSKPAPVRNYTVLGIAPDYDSSTWERIPYPDLLAARQSLAPVDAATQEIQRLDKAYYGRFLWGDKATELAFKTAELDHYSILHLAAYLKPSNGERFGTGLYFTEDGDTLEDDCLNIHEVSRYYIPARLVILQTLGNTPPSDLDRLRQSFFYAGVAGILSPLWSVDHPQSVQVLEYFYDEMRKKTPKSQALQQAKLQYLQTADPDKTHPFFWASFVLSGDDAPLELYRQANQGNEFLWGVAVGVLLVAWFLVGAFRRHRHFHSQD